MKTTTENELTKGKDYSFKELEYFAYNNYNLTEYGNHAIGTNFIVIQHNDKDIAYSFLLTGYNTKKGNIYTCIYSD